MKKRGMFSFGGINPRYKAQLKQKVEQMQARLKSPSITPEEKFLLERQIKSLQKKQM